MYHILNYPFDKPGVIGEIIKETTIERLEDRFTLTVDGIDTPWPDNNPHAIEQYIHHIISDMVSGTGGVNEPIGNPGQTTSSENTS